MMIRQPNTEYVLSLSYGKDSLACLGAIQLLGLPLDRIVHAEVWATDTIPADLPEMVAFKSKADSIIKEMTGIDVEHLCATRNGEKLTYEKLFYHIPKRKSGGSFADNTPAGFPYTKGAWCNDRLKTNLLDAIVKNGEGSMDGRGTGQVAEQRVRLKDRPCGFPYTAGSWCKRLKDGSYQRLPDHQGKLVYLSQTAGFLRAPWYEEPKQISYSI